jgi:hypothetical protein
MALIPSFQGLRLVLFRSFEPGPVELMAAWRQLFPFLEACGLDTGPLNTTHVDDAKAIWSGRFRETLASLARCTPEHRCLLLFWMRNATLTTVQEFILSILREPELQEPFHAGPFIWLASPEQWSEQWPITASHRPTPQTIPIHRDKLVGRVLAVCLPQPGVAPSESEILTVCRFLRTHQVEDRPSTPSEVSLQRSPRPLSSSDATTLPAKALSSEEATQVLLRRNSGTLKKP